MAGRDKYHSQIWQWSVFCFVIAGITGFVYRLLMGYSISLDISLEHIRHGHSHLMFFGWASLLPLYLIKKEIQDSKTVPAVHSLMQISFWIILVFGLISFPAFLKWGYRPVAIGSSILPVSAILSAMVMIGWYFFMTGYLLQRFRPKSFNSNIWFEGALIMLFVCSLGAWGVGLAGIFDFGSPLLAKALTHFFLSTFTEGWVLVVVLGFVSRYLGMKDEDFLISPVVLVGMITFGAPLTFPYGLSESLISIPLNVSARLGSILISQALLLFLVSVYRSGKVKNRFWIWPLAYLGIKSVMQMVAAVIPAEIWFSAHAVRILYLHVLLLGALSTTLVLYLTETWNLGKIYIKGFLYSIFMVLLSLIMLTGLWPVSWSGLYIYKVLAIISLFPSVALFILWLKVYRLKRASRLRI